MTRVLVIEDELSLQKLIRLMLHVAGMEAIISLSASDGLAALEWEQPDLVVLDLGLPDMDGRDVYRRIRSQGYEGPVVICSAYGAADAQRELGADAAISKPFDPKDFVDLIQKLLELGSRTRTAGREKACPGGQSNPKSPSGYRVLDDRKAHRRQVSRNIASTCN